MPGFLRGDNRRRRFCRGWRAVANSNNISSKSPCILTMLITVLIQKWMGNFAIKSTWLRPGCNNNNNNNRPSIFIPVNDLIMMHHPSAKLRHSSIPSSTLPKMSSSSDNDSGESTEIEKLRQTASKLRAEAQEAEKGLKRSPSSSAEENKYVKPVEYSTLSDSCWEITYRFANEPESNKDDNNDNNNNGSSTSTTTIVVVVIVVIFVGFGFICKSVGDFPTRIAQR
mmetsp:Transcript_19502/g.40833  ORF Transcript_19502/g.40833 Transcript_19502/m.40833 type:complete len:226 (-) Transcript_19502:1530-2207(-)